MNRKETIFYFLFNLSLFALVTQFVFSYNSGRLFLGNDGPMLLSLALDKLRYIGLTFDLHTNFLQGIGNLSFPVNPALLPPFWLNPYNEAGFFAPAAIYTGFALLTFVTILLVAWNHHFPRLHAYAAAWILTILLFPYFAKYFAVYPVNGSSPIFMIYLFAGALADIGLWKMGKGSLLSTILYAALLLFAMLIMLLVSPAALIIIAPFLAVSGICAFIAADKKERIRKLIAAAILGVIALAAGWVEYVAGLFLYSSGGFFFSDMMDSYLPSRQFGSILYHGRIADRAAGPVLFVLGVIGAIASRKHKRFFYPAIIALVGALLHGLVGAEFIKRSGGWSGPPPIYSEMLFYAFYALFMVSVLATLSRKILQRLPAHQLRYGLPLLATLLLVFWTISQPLNNKRDWVKSFAMPPADNDITDILEKEIALPPGGIFKGRAAQIIPANFNWQTVYAYRMNAAIGNDLQTSGLWLKNIPTLTEYNQLITPQFYLLIKNFLSIDNAANKQNRSWTSFSKINLPILRLLGVRFVLSSDAYIDGLKKRAVVAPQALQELRLYEIDQANIAGIAAEKVTSVATLNDAVAEMRKDSFKINNAIVVGADMKKFANLTSSTQSQISVENGAYHVQAASKGQSLLILPTELSHCTDVVVYNGKAPEIIKVDVALTGVLFEKSLDIGLVARTGPFHNPRCRLKDYKEFKANYRRDA